MEYKIINRTELSEFVDEVNTHLEQGWRLRGNVSTTVNQESLFSGRAGIIYSQSIVKMPDLDSVRRTA